MVTQYHVKYLNANKLSTQTQSQHFILSQFLSEMV
jgi:hypothetical protein